MRPTRPAALFACFAAATLAWSSWRTRAPDPVRVQSIPEIQVSTNISHLVADNTKVPILPQSSFANRRGPAIDVNSSPVEQLEILPRIGPSLAKRIVEERKKGPFRSADDLRVRVKGIGAVTAALLKNYLVPPPTESLQDALRAAPPNRGEQTAPIGRSNPRLNP